MQEVALTGSWIRLPREKFDAQMKQASSSGFLLLVLELN